MLSCHRLNKSFGALQVTRDVTLEVSKGERRAIIGPNGAGKTTLFNLISGEIRLNGGQVRLDGRDISTLSPDARARHGLARSFQRNSTFPDMTVGEGLIAAVALAQGLTWKMLRTMASYGDVTRTAFEIAASVGVRDLVNVPARELSYGAQRQLEIGLALASNPRLLMLDEPTAGMSPDETERMLALIAGLPRSLTIVMIEHDMGVVFSFADRITVLDQGAILAEGSPAEIHASKVVQSRYLGGGQA